MTRILYKILAVVSFGFYVHPIAAFENPAHPRSAEEVQEEKRREERKNDPCKAIEDENQREAGDNGDAQWASK